MSCSKPIHPGLRDYDAFVADGTGMGTWIGFFVSDLEYALGMESLAFCISLEKKLADSCSAAPPWA